MLIASVTCGWILFFFFFAPIVCLIGFIKYDDKPKKDLHTAQKTSRPASTVREALFSPLKNKYSPRTVPIGQQPKKGPQTSRVDFFSFKAPHIPFPHLQTFYILQVAISDIAFTYDPPS